MSGRNNQVARSARTLKPRGQSCLPCRQHKVYCSKEIPCKSCIRHNREDACRRNPPPTILGVSGVRRASNIRQTANHGSISSIDIMCRPKQASHPQSSTNTRSATIVQPKSGPSSPSIATPRTDQTEGPFQQGLGGAPWLAEPLNVAQLQRYGSTVSSTRSGFPIGRSPEVGVVKIEMIRLLPSPSRCDLLASYFFDHLNFIHRAVHVPSFRIQLAQFWTSPVAEIDLAWTSLLLIIICVAAFRLPLGYSQAYGMESAELRKSAQIWFNASFQALQASGVDSHPCLTHLQAFIVSQLYYLVTNGIESMNSHLGRAVRNAQALGLHKPSTSANILEKEMRHRIWWEMCHADTFQSMCLARPALMQSHSSKVPFPSHCNDIDIGEGTIGIRPFEEHTDLSLNLTKYKYFKVFNKLYSDNCEYLHSLDYVERIDLELSEVDEELPWYNKGMGSSSEHSNFDIWEERNPWEYHLMHSCICMQRLRMYRPFLQAKDPRVLQKCFGAVQSALSVYKALRQRDVDTFRKSSMLQCLGYQSFSIATFLSMFLLIERPDNSAKVREDLNMVLEDLEYLAQQPDCLPVEYEGAKVLRQIVEIVDQGLSAARLSSTNVARCIGTVFGGEASSRSYIEKQANQNTHETFDSIEAQERLSATDLSLFDTLPSTLLQWDQLEEWDSMLGDFFPMI